jgi:hypothetical protein
MAMMPIPTSRIAARSEAPLDCLLHPRHGFFFSPDFLYVLHHIANHTG